MARWLVSVDLRSVGGVTMAMHARCRILLSGVISLMMDLYSLRRGGLLYRSYSESNAFDNVFSF